MNHVFLVGTIASSPEVRTSQNGNKFVTMRVNVQERKRDGTTEHTCFPVELFGDTADRALSLMAGAQVICEGRLKMRAWQVNGKSGASMQFMCWNLVTPTAPKRAEPPRAQPVPMGDDIPF